jgi:hypothetical protein
MSANAKPTKVEIYKQIGAVRRSLSVVRDVVLCEEEVGDAAMMMAELEAEVDDLAILIDERTEDLPAPMVPVEPANVEG